MTFPCVPQFTPVKFNLFAQHGECFWAPWYSKDNQQAWSLIFEGKEGGPIDRFRDIKKPADALARAKEVIDDMCPWDSEWARDAEICDETLIANKRHRV